MKNWVDRWIGLREGRKKGKNRIDFFAVIEGGYRALELSDYFPRRWSIVSRWILTIRKILV